MGRTDASANSGSSGRPPPEATWAAIEEALQQAGTRDPGLYNALMQAKNLYRSDPAGAQHLLDEIRYADVLLGIGRGFMDVDAAGPWQESPGRAGGEASAGRASSGRTISISSGGGTGDDAVGAFGGGDRNGGGLQRGREVVMEEWQNILIELMSTMRIDDERMQHKLLAVLQFLKRSQLAVSSHLAQELGRLLKTTASASQAQADIRALILEFEQPVYRPCIKCSARRLVRCKPEPPASRIWCGHPYCVFSDRTCKPGGWDESNDYEKLFPRPLIDAAVTAHEMQPRKLRRLEEDGAAAGYQVGGMLLAKRSAPENSIQLHQEQSRQHQQGAPHTAGVMSDDGAVEKNGDGAYIAPPQLLVGGYAAVTTVVRGDDDHHPLVMESSLRPWLPPAQPVEGAPAEDRTLHTSNSWPGLKPPEMRITKGTPSEGNGIHFSSGQGYTIAPMTMRLIGDGSRLRLVPDVGGLSIGDDVNVPADAGVSTTSGNTEVHQAGLLRVTIEPMGHRQHQQGGVVLAPGQWRLCSQRLIETDMVENVRETSAAVAQLAASGPDSVSGRDAGLIPRSDRDAGESRQMMRGSFGEKGEALRYPACSRGHGTGGEPGAPPLSFASVGAGPEDSTGSGRGQGTPLHPNWVGKASRNGPTNSDDSGLQLAMTRSLMTSAGTQPQHALQAQPSFTQQPQRQAFPAQDASVMQPPPQVHTQLQTHLQPSLKADRPQQSPHLSLDIQQLRHLLTYQQQLAKQPLDQGHLPHPETSRAPRMVHSNTQRMGSTGPSEGANGFHSRVSVPQTSRLQLSQAPEPQAEVVILPDGRRALVLPESPPVLASVSIPMQGPPSSTGAAINSAATHGLPCGGVVTDGGRSVTYTDSAKGVTGTQRDGLSVGLGLGHVDEQKAGAGDWATQPVRLAAAIERRRQQQQHDCPPSVSYGPERTQAGGMVNGPGDHLRHQPQVQQASYHLQKQLKPQTEGIDALEQVLVAALAEAPATAPATIRHVLQHQKQDFHQQQQLQPTPPQQQQQQERRQQPAVDVVARSRGTGMTTSLPVGATAAGATGATSSMSTLALPLPWTSPSGTLPAASAAGGMSSASTGARIMRTPDGRTLLVEPYVPGASVDGSRFSGSGGVLQQFGAGLTSTTAVAVRSAPAVGTTAPARAAEPAISNQTVSAPPVPAGIRARLRLHDPAASDSTGSGVTLGPAAATVGTAAASGPSSSLSSDVRHGSAVHGSAVVGVMPGSAAGGSSQGVRLLLQPISPNTLNAGLDPRELPLVQTLPPPSGRAAAARAMRTPAIVMGLTSGTGQGAGSVSQTWAPTATVSLSSPSQYAGERALILAPEMLMDGNGASALATARTEAGALATMDAVVHGGDALTSALSGSDIWHPHRAGLQGPRGAGGAAQQPPMPPGRDMGGRSNGRIAPGVEADVAAHRMLSERSVEEPINGFALPARLLPRPMKSEELAALAPVRYQSYLQNVLSLAATPLVDRASEQLAAPAFGDKPEFLWHLPAQGDTATVQWSARIILRACDPRDSSSSSLRGVDLPLLNDAELLSMCADLPTALVPYLPSVMAAYEVRFRKDIPVTIMKGRPHMGWLSPDTTRQQREAFGRLALAKIAIFVQVDEQQDYILSPEVIEGCIMLVGVVLIRGPALHAANGAELRPMQTASASPQTGPE